MADDAEDEVVAKPKRKNPLVANKAKVTAKKVIEKAAAKPVAKAKAAPAPAKQREAGKGRQPSEEMQSQRTEMLALLKNPKHRKNGLTSVECKEALGWTSAQVAATSFGLVNQGLLSKEKDPVSGRVAFTLA